MPARTLTAFAAQVQKDDALKAAVQNDPVGTILQHAQSPLQTDVWVYRVVVGGLVLVVLVGLSLVATLSILGHTVPAIFTAAVSGAIGAVAGILAPPAQSTQ